MDATKMAEQLDEANHALEAIGDKDVESFAYPCGQSFFGEAKQSYIPFVRQRYQFARGLGQRIASAEAVDLSFVPAMSGQQSAAALEALAERAAQEDGWLVIVFHGVGGDYLATDAEAHERFLEYLSQHRDRFWVATFGQAGSAVRDYQSNLKK